MTEHRQTERTNKLSAMDLNEKNFAILHNLFQALMSPKIVVRRAAEQQMVALEANEGALLLLLKLVASTYADGKTLTPQDRAISLGAAVFFKNSIKRRWADGKSAPAGRGDCQTETTCFPPITPNERDEVKLNLIEVTCSLPDEIQRTLAEAVSEIAKHDFPQQWQGLLPQLIGKLSSEDIYIKKGVILTANSIMKKFRYAPKSDELYSDLKYCLSFHDSLLTLIQSNQVAIQQIIHQADSSIRLKILLETRRLVARTFFSLNWQDIPEIFEDNIEAWMTQFAWSLELVSPAFASDNNMSPSPIESLQEATIENLNLYAGKYDEEFNPYLQSFTQIIWQLLMKVDATPRYDVLSSSSMKFLTSVASKSRNASLFSESVIRDIVEKIVVKSLTATEHDEDIFENNPTDYIRKDIEGSDQDTRRRCATDLLRALLKLFEIPISTLCIQYVQAMLQSYNATSDWRAKDAALHLVLAVSVVSSSSLTGALILNPNVNIVDIFGSHVLPEIHDIHVNARPVVKADALKMICVFRSHLPSAMMLELIPHLLRHLQSKYIVIQTYSAYCIERFLVLRDDTPQAVSSPRITQQSLLPYAESLLSALFNVLDNTDLPENDYVMKCVMRVLVVLGPQVSPIASVIVAKLVDDLKAIYQNPSNPQYIHYLFESLACLVKALCFPHSSVSTVETANATKVSCSQFEAVLFPPFQTILANDITEFVPYVFQILAQLLSARLALSSIGEVGLSPSYQALFAPLLSPAIWERKGNIPALIDLMRAYVAVGMRDVIASGSVEGVLGVFQKLLASKSTEVYAFRLLVCLFSFNSYEAFAIFANGSAIPTIFGLLLTRLQDQMKDSKSPRFCKHFLHAMCLFSALYGGMRLYEVLETLTPGLTTMIVLNVWSNNIQNCCSLEKLEIKQMIVGATKLLFDTPILQNPSVWSAGMTCVIALVKVIEGVPPDLTQTDGEFEDLLREDEIQSREFDSTYSKLACGHLYHLDDPFGAANIGVSYDSVSMHYVTNRITSPDMSQIFAQLVKASGA